MIYLSRKIHSKKKYFLRVLKTPDQPAFELDEKYPPQFLPGNKRDGSDNKKEDLLKVWIKLLDTPYPSVVSSERPVISKSSMLSKKVKIELINSSTNELYDQARFEYKKAPLEKCIDDWSRKIKE